MVNDERLERERRLEKLAECPEGHDTRHFYSWLDDIDNLRQQVENLKCCGNCEIKCYKASNGNTEADVCCPSWQSDGLTREEREK